MRRLLGIFFLMAGSLSAQTTTFNGILKGTDFSVVQTGQVSFALQPGAIDTTISGGARFVPTTTFCEVHQPTVVSTSGTGTITVVVGAAQTWRAGDSILFVNSLDSTLNANTVAVPYVITLVNSTTSFNFTQSGTHSNGAGGNVGGLYANGGTGGCKVTQNTAITPANTSYKVGLAPNFSQTSAFNTYAIGSGPIDISTVVPTPAQMPAYSFVDLFSNQTIAGNKTFTGTVVCAGICMGFGGGGGVGSFQVNGSGLLSSSTINFINSPAFNGLTFTFTNSSLGNIQLGANGQLSNVGLANYQITFNTTPPMSGGGTVPLGGSLTFSVPACVASGSSHAAGLVPDPGSSAGTSRFLREDCTFVIPPTATVMGASGPSHAAGLVPDPGSSAGTTRYLREDGTFQVPAGSGTTVTIASGTAALGTSAISSGACATAVTSTATGTATTDDLMADFNADPTAVTGYAPSTSGVLTIIKYPTANTVNFKVCNLTASSITPGAITLNWRVVR
jgi:hypothetical protein